MNRITKKMLQNLVDRLNKLCDYPLTSYTKSDDPNAPISGYKPNPLNYHLSFEYGGVALYQMSSTPGCTGEESIFNCGHMSKRDLYNRIDSYLKGVEVGKSLAAAKQAKEITFTQLNSDGHGNPRYVCHYTAIPACDSYQDALALCRHLGSRKYNNKTFAGGIVFSTYNLEGLKKSIEALR